MKQWMIWMIVGVLGVGGLVLSICVAVSSCDLASFWLNVGTELMGAAGVYLLLDQFIGRREKAAEEKARLIEETQNEKQRLIEDMGSQVHDVAIAAAEKLERYGYLRDGSLQRANLVLANLQGVLLPWVDLQGAFLIQANLQDASLTQSSLQSAVLVGSSLRGADLDRVDFQGADLTGSDLQNASLVASNLQSASLRMSKLQDADLLDADLQDAKLSEVEYSERTTLPDGTKWASDTDMSRFTHPEHPDFWRSDDPLSPVYRGDQG